MHEADLPGLTATVLWAAFALAVAFGAIAQRTHFCTMGALADIVTLGDWTRMRMWGMAIGVAMIGFNAMVALGWVDAANSIYAAPRWAWRWPVRRWPTCCTSASSPTWARRARSR